MGGFDGWVSHGLEALIHSDLEFFWRLAEKGGYGFLGWGYGREGVSRWRGVGEGLGYGLVLGLRRGWSEGTILGEFGGGGVTGLGYGDERLGSVLVNGKGGGSVGLQWRCEAMVMEVWVVEEEMVWFGEREN
ncbi:uncharacterized protein G2W53_037435 [Senna tora]|uniref:Uncharacterized protein n=1 Tax=Senna tora TaxID=362788 RepID=A0A834SZ55_9FABA|nr:uncharacterized protein G2W53_037435 [Senna tora]